MPVTTSQQLANFYRDFADTEVTFTKEVSQAIRLNPTGVHLKCQGDQWPCVIYSSSMTSARIITNLSTGLNETIKEAGGKVSLRYSFVVSDADKPIAFLVKAKSTGFRPYGKENPNLALAYLEFQQRPPDDLIIVLGGLLDAKKNSQARTEWRVALSPVIVSAAGIVPDQTMISNARFRHRAVIRDISFSGCKAILATSSDDLLNEPVLATLTFRDPDEKFEIPARVCRQDLVEGHEGIAAYGFQFDSEHIPMAYKVRVNAAIRAQRADTSE